MRIKKTTSAVGVVGKVLNVPNNSTEDTYSCDYINDCNSYSTSETFTGKYWIDSKPIYRTVISMGNLANTTGLVQYTHNIANIDNVISQDGFITDGTEFIPFNSVYRITYPGIDDLQYDLGLLTNRTKIVYTTKQNRQDYEGYVTLEYTKTAD